MKNLRKALAAVIALTVMSVSATAFAEVSATGAFSGGNNAVTADYSEIAQNKVKATVDTTLATTGTQMTFLVLDDGTDVTNIGESDILYIDQKELTAGGNTFTGVINLARVSGAAVDATELPEGSYPIRVGYYYDDNGTQTFGLAAATMIVEEASSGTTVTIVWGDVDASGSVAAADITALVMRAIGGKTTFTDAVSSQSFTIGSSYGGIVWGDVDASGSVAAADITALVMRAIGGKTTFTDSGSGSSYTIGSSYDIVMPD